MRVLVCGGRSFNERRTVFAALREVHESTPITLIITGMSEGADGLGHAWGFHQKIPVCQFPANWRFVGRAAGPIRNQSMLDFGAPDLVVAFPGGRGTADMVARAKAAGVAVKEVPNGR